MNKKVKEYLEFIEAITIDYQIDEEVYLAGDQIDYRLGCGHVGQDELDCESCKQHYLNDGYCNGSGFLGACSLCLCGTIDPISNEED